MSQDLDDPPAIQLANVPQPGPWAARGSCRQVPIEVFFPGQHDDNRQALAICKKCPVQQECLEYALPHASLHGIWGGAGVRQRQLIRMKRAADAEAAEVAAREAEERASQAEAGSLARTLEELTRSPGEWARIIRYASRHSASSTASLLRSGDKPAPPGRWEFEARLNGTGGSDLYACFHGVVDDEVGIA